MQYTSKVALLAIALFGTSALAVPFASEADFDVEAREVENDLEAREFDEMYVEARDDLSLDARDLDESMDLEAREYLEYLEARAAASASTPPQSPQSLHSSSHESSSTDAGHKHLYLTRYQKSMHAAKKAALERFEDPKYYHKALLNSDSKDHRFAVLKYLSRSRNLKKVLADKESPYYRTAKRVAHLRKAKVYLSDKKNYKKALGHKNNRYHKDAVKVYLSQGSHFEYALVHKRAKFHKAAVHAYLLDKQTRLAAIADEHSQFYRQAVRLQKKIDKHHKSSRSSSSTTATPSATPKA